MKRVCHVTSVHSAKDTRIFFKECKSLSKKYEVIIVAANARDEIVDNIQIIGYKLPTSRFSRILKAKEVIKTLVNVNAEVYHFHDPELLPIGIILKKRIGKQIVFDSHEDVPMQILCKEYIPRFLRKPLSRLYSYYESSKMKKYDALVTVTPIIYNRLKLINPYTYQITNFPMYEEISHSAKWDRTICFTGSVSERYLHHSIINCLKNADARYVLAGSAYPSYLNRLKQLPNWDSVDYRGQVSYNQVLEILQSCSIGIVILFYSPNVGYKKGTLGVLKMFEYMMAGIPVIATDFELWKEIIDVNHCGICVNPYDDKQIQNAIRFLLDHPEEARKMGENGKDAVRRLYNWGSQESILFDLYDRLFSRVK